MKCCACGRDVSSIFLKEFNIRYCRMCGEAALLIALAFLHDHLDPKWTLQEAINCTVDGSLWDFEK